MTKHSALANIHVPYNWEYDDATDRAAATGFIPADVGKLARQLDDNSLWMLTDDSPETWVAIGGSAGTPIALVSDKKTRTAGDYTGLSSTSFADVDGTNLSITLTTGARRCRIDVIAVATPSTSNVVALDILIDGALQGQALGLNFISGYANTFCIPMGFSFTTAALSAGSHTFKLQYKVSSGSATLYAHTASSPLIFSVVEIADKVPA
jgi:hypothetical protein